MSRPSRFATIRATIRAMGRATIGAAVCALALATLAAPARADAIPEPAADFRATEIVRAQGRTMESTVYRSGARERREMTAQGQRMVMIVRPRARELFMLMPGAGMAMRMDYAQSDRDLDAGDLSRFDATAVGRETVAGLETTKYRLQGTDADGYGFQGHAWVTDDGIRARLEGTVSGPESGDMEMSIVLRDVARGPQPAELFQLPDGVRVMDMPAMQGQQNMMTPGAR